jgi:hypothetical protein
MPAKAGIQTSSRRKPGTRKHWKVISINVAPRPHFVGPGEDPGHPDVPPGPGDRILLAVAVTGEELYAAVIQSSIVPGVADVRKGDHLDLLGKSIGCLPRIDDPQPLQGKVFHGRL